ncbi:WD repeat and FYVE domain-containing protein 3-like, partial [Coregonus clupeaformis]|uniref:WD repeat and FYVE domain-containing protein 3-like n=1 Tax=Coregonus clupeaformis TaxID=59861 RepID=UPI001E1C7736
LPGAHQAPGSRQSLLTDLNLKLHLTNSSSSSSSIGLRGHPPGGGPQPCWTAGLRQLDSQPENAQDLQLAVANILQQLVHSERNQQILCEAGLHSNPLPALQPGPGEFLRLGNPLNCGAWDKKLLRQYRVHKPSSLSYDAEMRNSMTMSMEGCFGPDSVFTAAGEDNGQYRISRSLVRSAEGSTVPLTRVKCLVSMTTPHDIRLHGSAVTPAFVEFDTSLEGFG